MCYFCIKFCVSYTSTSVTYSNSELWSIHSEFPLQIVCFNIHIQIKASRLLFINCYTKLDNQELYSIVANL
jgi:hypothetical protein